MTIRFEGEGDAAAIREVGTLAFGQTEEADLVDALRADSAYLISLVAVDALGSIVGFVLFSKIQIRSEAVSIEAAALAPVAVRPEQQRQGIGGALIRRGLEECAKIGVTAVVVLGHAGYYPRFGFSQAKAAAFGPFSGESWMALELVPGALDGASGNVVYPAAFGI